MVREVAQVIVKEDAHEQFVPDLDRAVAEIFPHVKGAVKFAHVGWCVERPNVYMFTIDWETIEDHMVGFRDSDQFTQWLTIIGPHLDAPAVMEHFSL
jgi:hypothetical protein